MAAYSPLGGQRISKMNPVRQSDILEEIGKARGKFSGPGMNCILSVHITLFIEIHFSQENQIIEGLHICVELV